MKNFSGAASITLNDADDHGFISIYVRNIENSRRQLGGTANTGGLMVSAVEQPRTYGIRVGGKF